LFSHQKVTRSYAKHEAEDEERKIGTVVDDGEQQFELQCRRRGRGESAKEEDGRDEDPTNKRYAKRNNLTTGNIAMDINETRRYHSF